ncbi:MAG: hypothetical protein JO307_14280 [Bryobacterales bacterium]|nr:hypothetical protein [Bryobacterales bacterium]MBV9396488.1 hypothetical protein [Bryobacterales bacterium]
MAIIAAAADAATPGSYSEVEIPLQVKSAPSQSQKPSMTSLLGKRASSNDTRLFTAEVSTIQRRCISE